MQSKSFLIIIVIALLVGFSNKNIELGNISVANAAEAEQSDSKFDNFFNQLEEGASELGKGINEGLDTFVKDGRELLNDERWDQMLEKGKDLLNFKENSEEDPQENQEKTEELDPDQEPVKL